MVLSRALAFAVYQGLGVLGYTRNVNMLSEICHRTDETTGNSPVPVRVVMSHEGWKDHRLSFRFGFDPLAVQTSINEACMKGEKGNPPSAKCKAPASKAL